MEKERIVKWRFIGRVTLLFLFSESVLSEYVITDEEPIKCKHGAIQSGVTLRDNFSAETFEDLGATDNIYSCIQKCCDKEDCVLAAFVRERCYSVQCPTKEGCETVPVVMSTDVMMEVAEVNGVDDVEESDEIVTLENPVTKEELICTQSPILFNVTLRGGVKAGNFTDLGEVKNMQICTALCCEEPDCDLAFMIGETCVAVHCYNEELCQTIKARPSSFNPQISYIRRRETENADDKEQSSTLRPTIPVPTVRAHEIISDEKSHITILKTSQCSADKIVQNVTILGGIKSGNFTYLGKVDKMQECIGSACELGKGDLAFMLGNYCYSVSCVNARVCETIPAQPSKFIPKVAFLKWGPKINETETTLALIEETEYRITHHKYPKCMRSHIGYNQTLRGGIRAGNFTLVAEVDSIETCAALCCADRSCDLALMIGDNCYVGVCAANELCVPVPTKHGSSHSSQIAFMANRKEDHNRDWSLIYIVVGSIALIVGMIGIVWTTCLCLHRRNENDGQKDRYSLLDTEGDSVRGMTMLPKGWMMGSDHYGGMRNGTYMGNGPLYLSDSDLSDMEEELVYDNYVEERRRLSSPQDSQSVNPHDIGHPPPQYTHKHMLDMLNLEHQRMKRAMQNL